MQPNTQPDKGRSNAEQLQQLVQKELTQVRELLETKVFRLTLMLQGRKGREDINKVMTFPPGNVPEKDLYNFLEAYANRLASHLLILSSTEPLIKVGSDFYSMQDFIKDYSAGLPPSMNAEDQSKITALHIGENCTVKINNVNRSIIRIN